MTMAQEVYFEATQPKAYQAAELRISFMWDTSFDSGRVMPNGGGLIQFEQTGPKAWCLSFWYDPSRESNGEEPSVTLDVTAVS